MNKFYVITNSKKDVGLLTTRIIKTYLEKCEKECIIHDADLPVGNAACKFTDAEKIPADTDCIIVLGGDGTLIQAARDTVALGIPLLGINLGTLGYLAEIDRQNVVKALDRLIQERYTLESRMMLTGSVYRDGKLIHQDIALNDIVIGRNGHLRVINLNLFVNKAYLNSYAADGIIISTPTGSTGYNLSVGGPIVEPQASMILVTPIAPHTLNTRSIVLAAEDAIEVEVGMNRKETEEQPEAIYDGDAFFDLKTGDRIIVQKAVQDTKIIKISNISFLEVLREKMSNK